MSYSHGAVAPYDRHNWLEHLFTLKGSVIPAITSRVFGVMILSAGITYVEKNSLFPIAISPLVHMIVGSALALLLTFRTNTAYERFWEGRRAWGGMVNSSRSLMRQCHALLPIEMHAVVAALIWSFARGAAAALTNVAVSAEDHARIGEALFRPPGVPQRSLVSLSELFQVARKKGLIDPFDVSRLEESLTHLTDALGACERIQKTPIPLGYVLHIRRFLVVFLCTLPAALAHELGWYTVIACGYVAYGFFGIEQIGVEIEDPFDGDANDIDLNAIVATIDRDTSALVA